MTGPNTPDEHPADSVTSDDAGPGSVPGHQPGRGTKATKATTETGTGTPAELPAHLRRDTETETAAAADLLIRALRTLGNAGHVELASRLAGHAWAALRTGHPRAADRLNGLLHYLARLPAGEAPSTPTQARRGS